MKLDDGPTTQEWIQTEIVNFERQIDCKGIYLHQHQQPMVIAGAAGVFG
jgi:hypothetical protein